MSRILVIDDENNIRLMVRLALQANGHIVETASDGREGLELFTREDFDAILLDQRMPGMDGIEVLRAMKKRDVSCRVMMITAFGTVDLAAEAMRAGASDFLRKPFTTEVLRDAVSAVLSRETSAPEKTLAARDASINGFRITSSTRNEEKRARDGDFSAFFEVQRAGETTTCEVVLPRYVVEVVKAYADRETMPDAEHFWTWLCEESLANYLWQNAEVPANGVLQVEELSTNLRRWIDAVLG